MVMPSVWQSGIALVVRFKQIASYSYSDHGTTITSFEEHTVETLKCVRDVGKEKYRSDTKSRLSSMDLFRTNV